ncbi:hypothetical protein DPMN_128309 [Dreissena polymorpha]|uniref:Uncharacterized protein n=1 Tax=Dreissena polymorpha TaxID=45954 RepID=A0A9D4GZA1_DREPO|nr:hypothetical protein DPMN_128309 [Dreissena polymorpha]
MFTDHRKNADSIFAEDIFGPALKTAEDIGVTMTIPRQSNVGGTILHQSISSFNLSGTQQLQYLSGAQQLQYLSGAQQLQYLSGAYGLDGAIICRKSYSAMFDIINKIVSAQDSALWDS